MNAKLLLRVVPLCLWLLPVLASAQGVIGPLEPFQTGAVATSSARAGSLAFFTTLSPSIAYPPQPPIPGFLRSDGTWEGTFPLTPLASRLANSHGDLLFYTCAASDGLGLCRSDGTAAGTFPVTEGLSLALDSGAAELPVTLSLPERNLELFAASPRPGSPDFELWATDGTPEGTRLVQDVNPEGSSNPRRMIALAGQAFFLADTPRGRELWRSDGTPEGTERVHAFPGQDPAILVRAGGALFVVEDAASGVEVWQSDGTETTRVLDLSSRLRAWQAAGRNLFLVTRGEGGDEMAAIDGATGEAVQVLQGGTLEIELLAVGDRVAFSLEDDHGREPWWSDGTLEGTHRIADLCPGPCDSSPAFFGTYGGRAVFEATDGHFGREPRMTDGTADGTFWLGDLCSGECGSVLASAREVHGWLVLQTADGGIWISDGTELGAWTVGKLGDLPAAPVVFPDRILFVSSELALPSGPILFATLPVSAPAPPPVTVRALPPGAWMSSDRVPGYGFRVQIDGQTEGRREPACLARTLCVSGALPGRSEVFVRVDPPALVKLTTSAVDVWIRQIATGRLRHYRLNGTDPAASNVAGLIDREGFLSAPATAQARAPRTPPPPGRWIGSNSVPGFRVQARLTADGKSRILRKEPCVAETFCLGGVPGQTDLLVRVTGPRPNGWFWPMLARFAPATIEVWIEQRKTGKVRYYRLAAPPAGSSALDGLVDRLGFKR